MEKKLIISGIISFIGLITIIIGLFLPAIINTTFCLLGLTTMLGGLHSISVLLKKNAFKKDDKLNNIEISDYKSTNTIIKKQEIVQKTTQKQKNNSKNNDICK